MEFIAALVILVYFVFCVSSTIYMCSTSKLKGKEKTKRMLFVISWSIVVPLLYSIFGYFYCIHLGINSFFLFRIMKAYFIYAIFVFVIGVVNTIFYWNPDGLFQKIVNTIDDIYDVLASKIEDKKEKKIVK